MQLTYLPTSSQIADVFIKILPSQQFNYLLSKLGMVDILSSLSGGVKYNADDVKCDNEKQ